MKKSRKVIKSDSKKQQNECITLEADSRQQVLVGGDCVQTLPVSQLPDFTGVIATSCRQVIPECRQLRERPKVTHIHLMREFFIKQGVCVFSCCFVIG